MDCPNEGKRAAAYARLFCPMLVRAVLLWLERMGVPQCHRGDVAGQVWLNACESWPRFDPKRGRPERWLNAITVHVASHYHERARKRRENWSVRSRCLIQRRMLLLRWSPTTSEPAPWMQ
ncbi:sigma factor [Sorangium sp. So ce204]|uniref:sigma factor n=1 Tax=Sorangium sp. So ce204 TaxID=3133288 RepID=UPI003F641167